MNKWQAIILVGGGAAIALEYSTWPIYMGINGCFRVFEPEILISCAATGILYFLARTKRKPDVGDTAGPGSERDQEKEERDNATNG